MARILKVLLVIIGIAVMLVFASLFVRVGGHDDSRASDQLLAIPVPPWCISEIERFSTEWLRDSQSRLVHVEIGLARYPYVGAVLLIRPVGEKNDLPRLALEEHHRHCGIREEFRFFGPGALEQAIQSIQSGSTEPKRHFVLEIDGPEGVVRVVPLPSIP